MRFTPDELIALAEVDNIMRWHLTERGLEPVEPAPAPPPRKEYIPHKRGNNGTQRDHRRGHGWKANHMT